ncbi:MAG: glycoside hydrolase family 5 protein [Candidatus Parvarchaeota archaeon]|nr:glycoside hydrolase family 5 protein [Candidatus Jingweiarchaeum tengchongense]MCW1306182.1 glycoside hydrolase family 5 protein [Candidatus Jingweiarchaeum tengchongense]
MKKVFYFTLLILIFTTTIYFADSVKSFVTIAPSGSYFEINGKPLILDGYNEQIVSSNLIGLWTNTEFARALEFAGILNETPEQVDEYFKELHDNGVNVLRIFFEFAQDPSDFSLFENPLGTVNESVVEVWNQIFALAKKYDIYLLIEPYDPYDMVIPSTNWQASPFNVVNGGPLKSLDGFLTNPTVIKDTEFRFKFMIDHWGNSSHILAWEVNNEIDLWYGSNNDPAIQSYIKTISDFIVNYEDKKFGHHHLITVSTGASTPTGALAAVVYDNSHLDFLTTHLYPPDVANPTSTIEPALTASESVLYNLEHLNYSKPYFDSEWGPIDHADLPIQFDSQYYHNVCWAEFSSGAAGIGLRWIFRNSLPKEFLQTNKAFSEIVNAPGINWLEFRPFSAATKVQIPQLFNSLVIPFSCGDQDARIIWLLKNTENPDEKNVNFGNVTLKVSGFQTGNYTVQFWNTITGEMLKSLDLQTVNGVLSFTVDLSKMNDMAIKIFQVTNE